MTSFQKVSISIFIPNNPRKKKQKPFLVGIALYFFLFIRSSLSAGECIQGDCLNGEGTMKFSNGDTYTGTFKDQKKIGYGIYTFNNGERYEGEFQGDFPNGKGIAYLANGNVYTGYFINNVPDGNGKMVFSNGNIYDGDWRKGVREGKGTMSYVDGSVYTGDWKANKKTGYGTFKKTIVVGMELPQSPMPTKPIKKIRETPFWISKIQN